MKKETLIKKFKNEFAKSGKLSIDQVVNFLDKNLGGDTLQETHRQISTYSPLETKKNKVSNLPKGVKIRTEAESMQADGKNGI